MTGVIFDIKEFSLHDGPGARTTVFLKGCPLRCRWCHNPEGLSKAPQILVKNNLCTQCGRCREDCEHPECQPFDRCIHACPNGLIQVSGKEMKAEELAQRIVKDKDFFEACGGGVTFSGGEPLMQSEFLLEVLPLLEGIHKTIETSGYAPLEVFRKIIEQMDYVMMDIKLADREQHKEYTGVYNDRILENLRWLKESGKPFILRTPMIPGITDTKENLEAVEAIVDGAEWEKLEYNAFAGAKYPMLGMEYPLDKEKQP